MHLENYKQCLKMSYEIHRPCCALSSPGLGKSSAVFQVCEELGKEYSEEFGMIEIRGASSSPSELASIKYVDAGSVLEAEQDWLPTNEKVAEGLCPARGYIFCDEITASLPAVQSTLQRLFLDRKLGNLSVADGWAVTAAGNRAKDKSASGSLSRAFQNRCIMIEVTPDPDILFDYGLKQGFHPAVLGFLRFRPECINDGMEVKKTENQAFGSPRSLHIASDVLHYSHRMSEALQQEVMLGILGDGVGTEFSGFLRVMDSLPNLDKLLKNAKEYPISEKLDVVYATIGALIARADKKNAKAIMQYFTRLTTEMSVVAIKDLLKVEESVKRTPEFISWASDNIKFAS